MYILNIARAIKKCLLMKSENLFENHCKRTGFSKEISYYSMKRLKKKKKDLLLLANKLIEHICDPRNAKEHCQSFI